MGHATCLRGASDDHEVLPVSRPQQKRKTVQEPNAPESLETVRDNFVPRLDCGIPLQLSDPQPAVGNLSERTEL
jgi:hypothetical protein